MWNGSEGPSKTMWYDIFWFGNYAFIFTNFFTQPLNHNFIQSSCSVLTMKNIFRTKSKNSKSLNDDLLAISLNEPLIP